jgi:uncharacterized protein YjaG (DUF416 family)
MLASFLATEDQLNRIEQLLGHLDDFRIFGIQPDLVNDRLIITCDCTQLHYTFILILVQ